MSLGMSEEEARYRLHNMLVEEVSLVDRAANRRKYLIVKSAGAAMPETTKANDPNEPADQIAPATDTYPAASDGAAMAELTLPTPVKEGLLRILTEALERLVSVTEMVKGAQETSDQIEEPVPANLGTELLVIADLLRGSLSRYPSPVTKDDNQGNIALDALASAASEVTKAQEANVKIDMDKVREIVKSLEALTGDQTQEEPEAVVEASTEAGSETPSECAPPVVQEEKAGGPVSNALRQVGNVAAKLADRAAAGDSIDAETIAGVRQLASMLNVLVEKYPEPQMKSAEDEKPTVDTTKAEGMQKLRDAVALLEGLARELDPELHKRLLASTVLPDPATGAYGSIGTGGSPDDTLAGPALEEVEGLSEVMKKIQGLTRVVKSLAEVPEAPASRQEQTPKQGKQPQREHAARTGSGGRWVW